MAKWVTFYEDVFCGVRDYVEHPDKETATRYFKAHYRQYFQLSTRIDVKLPMSYGYLHRKYRGMTLRQFQKVWGAKKEA